MSTYKPHDWQTQMHRALKGDATAYRALLEGLRPWLVQYFSRRLKGADTDDLVQMTLLSLHEKRHTYDPAAPFGPWLAAVARHKLIDHVRKSGRRVVVELDENLIAADFDSADETASAMARKDVEVLLKTLPAEQARLIRLHKLSDLSVQEVSDLTGHSVANVKVMVHRGLKKLQALVGGGTS